MRSLSKSAIDHVMVLAFSRSVDGLSNHIAVFIVEY